MYSSMITPVWTETPNSARKPTPEETLKFVCVIRRASRPPSGASITLTRSKVVHFKERNIVYRMMKISRTVSGTIMDKRALARFALSYSPSQSM